jgi:hypothetical protein
MPSQIPQGALLATAAPAFDDDDDNPTPFDDGDDAKSPSPSSIHAPWCWSAWQTRTGENRSPFAQEFNKETSIWDSAADSQAVWTYANNFWALPEAEQVDYAKRSRSDNDKHGRLLWLDWVNKNWADWKIHDTIDKTLSERALDPFSIMKRLKVAKVLSFSFFFFFFIQTYLFVF